MKNSCIKRPNREDRGGNYYKENRGKTKKDTKREW